MSGRVYCPRDLYTNYTVRGEMERSQMERDSEKAAENLKEYQQFKRL